MLLTRRGLITGLASLVAAPAIVRCSSLMPVKAWAEETLYQFHPNPLPRDMAFGDPLLTTDDGRWFAYDAKRGAWLEVKAPRS